MHVYVISVSPTGPCKIGSASNVLMRFAQVQTGNHCVLKLEASVKPEATARQIEAVIHQWFAPARIRGEWFDVTPNEAIAMLKVFGEVQTAWEWPETKRPVMTEYELMQAVSCHPRYKT